MNFRDSTDLENDVYAMSSDGTNADGYVAR